MRELLSATNVSDVCKALIHGQDFACDMLGAAIEWFPKDTAIAFIHTWVMGLLNVGDSVERKAIYEAYHTMFRKEFETYPEFLLLKLMGDDAFNCPNDRKLCWARQFVAGVNKATYKNQSKILPWET